MSYTNMLKNLQGKQDRNGHPRSLLADHICNILEEGLGSSDGLVMTEDVRDILHHALSFLYPGEREAKITELLYSPGDSAIQRASEVVDMFHCIANTTGEPYELTSASAMQYISQRAKAPLWALWAILEAYADQPMWMYPPKNFYTSCFKNYSNYTAYLTAVRTFLKVSHPEAEGS